MVTARFFWSRTRNDSADWWPSSCGARDSRWSRRATGPKGSSGSPTPGPFDLVLVDLNLPVFSGVEVCRRIKRDNPGQRLMICSAAILPNHEDALAPLGVDHFLTKPYHPEDLIAHIAQEIGPPRRRP